MEELQKASHDEIDIFKRVVPYVNALTSYIIDFVVKDDFVFEISRSSDNTIIGVTGVNMSDETRVSESFSSIYEAVEFINNFEY